MSKQAGFHLRAADHDEGMIAAIHGDTWSSALEEAKRRLAGELSDAEWDHDTAEVDPHFVRICGRMGDKRLTLVIGTANCKNVPATAKLGGGLFPAVGDFLDTMGVPMPTVRRQRE